MRRALIPLALVLLLAACAPEWPEVQFGDRAIYRAPFVRQRPVFHPGEAPPPRPPHRSHPWRFGFLHSNWWHVRGWVGLLFRF